MKNKHKTVQKDTREDMNKQRYAGFLVGSPNTTNGSIIHKWIYKHKEIPIRTLRISRGIFQTEGKKMYLEQKRYKKSLQILK